MAALTLTENPWSFNSLKVATWVTLTKVQKGSLSPNQVMTYSVNVEQSGAVLFTLSWPTSTLRLTLTSPSNLVINPSYALSNPSQVSYEFSTPIANVPASASYLITNAQTGLWMATIQSVPTATIPISYNLVAGLEKGITLTVTQNQSRLQAGAIAVFTATLSGSFSSALVSATLTLPDGLTQTVILTPTNGSNFVGQYPAPSIPGYILGHVNVSSIDNLGNPLEREDFVAFQVTSQAASFNGVYSSTPTPYSGFNPPYRSLDVSVGVVSNISGTFTLSGDLVDATSTFVAHTLHSQTLITGSQVITLSFVGDDIQLSKRDGSYTLTNLLLLDDTNGSVFVQEANNTHTTPFYLAQNFGRRYVYLPLILR